MKYLMVKYSLAAFRAIRRGDGSAVPSRVGNVEVPEGSASLLFSKVFHVILRVKRLFVCVCLVLYGLSKTEMPKEWDPCELTWCIAIVWARRSYDSLA